MAYHLACERRSLQSENVLRKLRPADSEPKSWLSSNPKPVVLAPSLVPSHQVATAIARPRIVVQIPARGLANSVALKSSQETKALSDFKPDKIFSKSEITNENKVVDKHDDQPGASFNKDVASVYNGENSRFRPTVINQTRPELDQLNGNSCTGTVSIGMRAYLSSALPIGPNVVAGQVVTAKAQFFRRSDGSSWVRFAAFDRPPLDLTVQPTRTGFTWTGEYGITHAVKETGGGRLAGLAAKIANDSVMLNFNCSKSLNP